MYSTIEKIIKIIIERLPESSPSRSNASSFGMVVRSISCSISRTGPSLWFFITAKVNKQGDIFGVPHVVNTFHKLSTESDLKQILIKQNIRFFGMKYSISVSQIKMSLKTCITSKWCLLIFVN